MTRKQEIIEDTREHTNKVILASPSTALYFETDEEWANQFLKNLWHNADEEPKKNSYILIEVVINLTPKNVIGYYVEYIENTPVKIMKTEGFKCRWAYIKDLLPKGGKK